MRTNLGIWDGVKEKFISEFGSHTYKFWIDPLSVTETQEGVLELQAPNIFFADWIRERYVDKILQYLKDLTGREYRIKLTIVERPLQDKTIKPSQVISKHILERLNPNYTFADFVVGECNKLAHAAALAVTASPAKAYNPLFIYGGVGLGKTHLLHAIGHEIINHYPHFRVQYISSEEFTNQLIQA
ncbi:MAG: chromosomal replication initiator protein DnaA, partial [Candidatus Omnitrophota bacterium]